MDLANEKGSSCWLTCLPLDRYGFHLTKSEFRDALHLRYGWEMKNTPKNCPCRATFTTSHALHCAKGGYTIMRHNEVRDLFGSLMAETCNDVQIEPLLQPLDGETSPNRSTTTDSDSRLDIKASGFWGPRFSRTFSDVKIFNPLART